ncbi:MAG: CBS domain-containing protein [Nitrospira sp.]
MITVGQLMKRTLATVPARVNAVDAAKLMSNCKIVSVFEEDDNHIIGLVTEPDSIRTMAEIDQEPPLLSVDAIMSKPIAGIDERRPITEAADLMHQHGIRHLMVFKAETVVGVLAVRDLLRPVLIDEF